MLLKVACCNRQEMDYQAEARNGICFRCEAHSFEFNSKCIEVQTSMKAQLLEVAFVGHCGLLIG